MVLNVLIISFSLVFVSMSFMSVMSFYALGPEGFKKFITDGPPVIEAARLSTLATFEAARLSTLATFEAARLSVQATVELFAKAIVSQAVVNLVAFMYEPWTLTVFFIVFFVWTFYTNWGEAKLAMGAVFGVSAEAFRAVWVVISNPSKMLQYGLFFILVRTFPEIVGGLSAQTMKSAKS